MNYQFWYHPYFGKQHLHSIVEHYSNLTIKEFGKDVIDDTKINLIPFYWENKLVKSNKIISTDKFINLLKELKKLNFYLIGDFSGEAFEKYVDDVGIRNLDVISKHFDINKFFIIQNNFDIRDVVEIQYEKYKIKTIHLPYFILSTPIHMESYVSNLSEFDNIKKKKDFICLNRRVKKHKFLFLRELYDRNLLNKTNWTYVSNYVSEDLFNEGSFTKDVGISFYDFKPIQLAEDVYYGQDLDYKDEFLYTINPKWYFESKVDLVVETFNHRPCHITEKIIKPIYLGLPFVVYSSKNYLERLKQLGFKDYTSVIGDYDTNKISSVIDAGEKLRDVYDSNDIKEIINYNKSIIRNKNHLIGILNNTFYTQLNKLVESKSII